MDEITHEWIHRCRCIIVTHLGDEERCGAAVSNDQPFCRSCEDRHDGMVRMGEIRAVTAVPLRMGVKS